MLMLFAVWCLKILNRLKRLRVLLNVNPLARDFFLSSSTNLGRASEQAPSSPKLDRQSYRATLRSNEGSGSYEEEQNEGHLHVV